MDNLVDGLESLKMQSTAGKTLIKLAKFVEPALSFLNCHFTDYYLKNYWSTLIPEKLRIDLELKSVEEVQKCMTDLTTGAWKNYSCLDYSKDFMFQTASNLEELIVSVGKLKLSELDLCTTFKQIEDTRGVLREKYPELIVDLEFDTFMSSKKMHEVFKFSEFIACTCVGASISTEWLSSEKIESIVDVGSGKGYLSSFLALYYDLKVLAIDASESNTEGCEKRAAKLDKTWPQLVRRAKERQRTGSCTNFGKHWRKKLAKMGISEEQYWESLKRDVTCKEDNLKSITEMITTKTDLQQLVDKSLQEEETKQEYDMKYGIVGLHTCGNLGANILKLFLHNKNAKFICVVPCCYNLVQEDESLYPETVFYGSKFATAAQDSGVSTKSAPWPDGSIGFPLSTPLNNYEGPGKTFVVGRNARMLSAYSLPRMIESESGLGMPPVLNYRAMLQVVLKEHGHLSDNDEANSELRVGRMTKKCDSFKDYVSFAVKKLGIDETTLDASIIETTVDTYEAADIVNNFHKYYLLRAMFAAVVEDLILLDRIVYLAEHESIGNARLVQLFNPALSPRSHAIVAVKKF